MENVYEYIKKEEANFKTEKIPITSSKSWNMAEHIERCTNVANGWFHRGENDGERPYNDIVTPIINVAFRTEGFNVEDIVPFVDDKDNYYKSFIVKKRHPRWARDNKLDTFIDEVVETSVIYDLVIIRKSLDSARPEVIDLKNIAFCDQSNALGGPICIKHYLTPTEIRKQKGVWDDGNIDIAINEATKSKKNSSANDKEVKTTGKNVEVYELVGELPETWIKEDGDPEKYVSQKHYISYYTDREGKKQGLTFYKGKDKSIHDTFKQLKIDQVRSKGRACGRSIVEILFDPQVWTNYDEIKQKELLDSVFNVLITDSDELGNQRLTDLETNTILKREKGATVQHLTSDLGALNYFEQHKRGKEESGRILGSASEGSLGVNPTAGTPFALQNLIVNEGQGIHEYRQGKIATFFSDELYRDWILEWLVKDMINGKSFSETLTLQEIEEIEDNVVNNYINDKVKKIILEEGKYLSKEDKEAMKTVYRENFRKEKRKFFSLVKDELKDIPMDVFINIKGKQKNLAQNADKITNVIREVLRNPQAFIQVPGIGDAFNQLLESSGMSPIDFKPLITAPVKQEVKSSAFEAEELSGNNAEEKLQK